jgi:colanic acid/amylovoran biosynthesis glycosyltransferase
MKIAIVVSEFPALSETFILSHVTSLLDRGAEVTVLAHRPRAESTVHPEIETYGLREKTWYSGQPARRWPRVAGLAQRLASAAFRRRLPAALAALDAGRWGRTAANLDLLYAATGALPASRRFDIVHCHFGDCALRGAFLREAGLIEGRLVATLHGADDIVGVEPLRRLFELGDAFLPISEFWSRKLADMGCPQEKLRVHHVGIDTRRFAFKERARAPGEALRLATVCRLAEKKGLEVAIQAIAMLREQRPDVPLHFSIVGDGPLEGALRAQARELGLTDSVAFLGPRPRDEVVRVLEDAHAFFHPSVTASNGEREGIPVSIMEAMASGLPVVATWHSGIPELVEDGVSGLLAPEHDVGALARHLAALADDPALLPRMGKAGRAAVEKGFDQESLDRALWGFYEELLGADPSEAAPPMKIAR